MAPLCFKYDYRWGGADWLASPQPISRSELKRFLDPTQSLILALEAFHSRFYPDEPVPDANDTVASCLANATTLLESSLKKGQPLSAHDLRRVDPIHSVEVAWAGHRAGRRYYDQLAKTEQAQEAADKWPEFELESYEQSLLKKLNSPWLLSWHWRSILPYLGEGVPERGKKLVVQISQIRQWELVLCYQVNSGVELQSLPELRSQKKSLQDLKLIRAPLFGVSHRTMQWDVYRRLLHKDIRDLVDEAITRSRDNPTPLYPKPLAIANILGRHDSYYKIDEVKVVEEDVTEKIEISGEIFIDFYPEHAPYSNQCGHDDFPLARPSDVVDIPAFGEEEGAPLLLASDNYCKALDQLSEVMNDPTAQSVLIIAPPGSGKEQLARMAYVCNNRLTGAVSQGGTVRPWTSVALAGLAVETVRDLLFRLSEADKHVKHGRLDDDYSPRENDGLVFRALGGALFIDEVDKASVDVRSMLLRFLESREVTIPGEGNGHLVRLRKHQIPQYIFAGSVSRREMFDRQPADFWTRISHVVEMSHPLDVGNRQTVAAVAKEYIFLFWVHHVSRFLRESRLIRERTESPGNAYEILYERLARPYFLSFEKFLISPTTLRFVCDVLADELVARQQALPSVRRIRAVVGRGIFQVSEMLLHAKDPGAAIDQLKREATLDSSAFSDWFRYLSRLIGRIHQPETEGKLDRLELQFVSALREALYRSASFS